MDENRDCGLLSVGGIRILTVIGQIEGHMLLPAESKTTKYEHMLPLLCAIEEDETASGLLLLLNTVGGDTEAGLAKLSVVGVGMRSNSGVAATMFRSLADAGITPGMIATSEIRITTTVEAADIERAACVVHDAFHLNTPQA